MGGRSRWRRSFPEFQRQPQRLRRRRDVAREAVAGDRRGAVGARFRRLLLPAKQGKGRPVAVQLHEVGVVSLGFGEHSLGRVHAFQDQGGLDLPEPEGGVAGLGGHQALALSGPGAKLREALQGPPCLGEEECGVGPGLLAFCQGHQQGK